MSLVITGCGSIKSAAVMRPAAFATDGSLAGTPVGVVAKSFRSGGAEMIGGVRSATVTVNAAVPEFPAPSCAEQSTFVTPIGKREPDPGVQTTTAIGPLTRSTAVGVEYVADEPDE